VRRELRPVSPDILDEALGVLTAHERLDGVAEWVIRAKSSRR
jgi:hypothetical protein